MIWAFLLISLFHCEASRLTNPENAGDRFTKGASCNQRQLLDVKCDFHPSFTRVVTRVTVSMRAFLPNMSAGTWPWRRAESWQYPILHIPDAFHEHLGCVYHRVYLWLVGDWKEADLIWDSQRRFSNPPTFKYGTKANADADAMPFSVLMTLNRIEIIGKTKGCFFKSWSL